MIAPRQEHDRPPPARLGTVSFPISCKPVVQQEFNRALALLHSFAYQPAQQAFDHVSQQDPACAIAHWGSAMTHYHQLWDLPPSPVDAAAAEQELQQAGNLDHASRQEQGLLRAIGLVFPAGLAAPYPIRARSYEAAMRQLALDYPDNIEIRIFYALALISNAPPADREHQRQKQAAALLQPLFLAFPDHPGVPHYLIHACDNQELAPQGLVAARAYAGIAPAAPHALHMPSHIFIRLGLWDESIAANLAAKNAAHQQHDTGEELHAMDYLVYAYLQTARDQDAALVVQQLKAMQNLNRNDFKIGYAATAIPIRYIVERGEWGDAAKISNPAADSLPQVMAIAVWARGLGYARTGRFREAEAEAGTLHRLNLQLQDAGSSYWATQVEIMKGEVAAWAAQAAEQSTAAVTLLSNAADAEDGLEKLPVTPGPILPAREQLAELFRAQGNAAAAADAYRLAAVNTPGRRRLLQGTAQLRQSLPPR